MGSDSIANEAIPPPPPLAFFKDIGRRKRTNKRLAKLKQSKLDVRREQWLSQVKNNGTNVASNGWGGSPPAFSLVTNEVNKLNNSLKSGSKEVDMEEGSIMIQQSEMDSLMTSPGGTSTVHGSCCSSASSRCCSSSVSETEGDDSCLDDWETLADALTANDIRSVPNCEPLAGDVNKACLADPELQDESSCINVLVEDGTGVHNCRAWIADDASRPQSLRNLLKENSPTMKQIRRVSAWAWQNIISQPASCPICCDDFDITDLSFFPCPCGFRICLFCHKRILEADGRCPGCRKQYDHTNKGNPEGMDLFKLVGLSA